MLRGFCGLVKRVLMLRQRVVLRVYRYSVLGCWLWACVVAY